MNRVKIFLNTGKEELEIELEMDEIEAEALVDEVLRVVREFEKFGRVGSYKIERRKEKEEVGTSRVILYGSTATLPVGEANTTRG